MKIGMKITWQEIVFFAYVFCFKLKGKNARDKVFKCFNIVFTTSTGERCYLKIAKISIFPDFLLIFAYAVRIQSKRMIQLCCDKLTIRFRNINDFSSVFLFNFSSHWIWTNRFSFQQYFCVVPFVVPTHENHKSERRFPYNFHYAIHFFIFKFSIVNENCTELDFDVIAEWKRMNHPEGNENEWIMDTFTLFTTI